jgi:hypothetical protein
LGIFGHVDQHRTVIVDGEFSQAGRSGGYADRQIQTEPGFADLRSPSDDPDGRPAPDVTDEPALVGTLEVEFTGQENGKVLRSFLWSYPHRNFLASAT